MKESPDLSCHEGQNGRVRNDDERHDWRELWSTAGHIGR